VRAILGAVLSLLLVSTTASAQSLTLQGSAGPTMTDSGYSLGAGIGFSPTSRLTLLFDVERTHLSSRFTSDGRGGGSAFRGGTVTFAAAELRVTLLGRDRVSPYVFGGTGAGVSRPNVNERFPNPVTNDARVLFLGGGVHVPLRGRISVCADVRMVFGPEGNEGMLAFAPVRAGLAWRF
jgi:hypothetical protein